jgi:hypothetical protein
MHRKLMLLARGFALAALAIGLGGCGKPQFAVSGKVKYNGAPLAKPNGQIVFVGPEGTQVAAPIELDGTYKAAKVPAGLNRVAVYYPNPSFTKAVRPKGPPTLKDRPTTSSPYLTPDIYADVETSKLAIKVEKNTDYDAELTGPKIR